MKVNPWFLYISLFIFMMPLTNLAQSSKEHLPVGTDRNYGWWNLLHYTIVLSPQYDTKSIKGTNTMLFKATKTGVSMRIDLYRPLNITSITMGNETAKFIRNDSLYIVTLPRTIKKGDTASITIDFQGLPHVASNPPFDNGWIWSSDKKGRPWISVACQGFGAAIWLPCKNVTYDEPDNGVTFTINIPDSLSAVANGRLEQVRKHDGLASWTWKVHNNINHYNIIPCIGKYVTWQEPYSGTNGTLDRQYWVLDYNLEKAKKHFRQSDTLLRCFEEWLGPYPFYEDSYKVVEAPMVGMEHQSAIAYGNGFENGYGGHNLSGTKWGDLWDFILVHESGHEWFGNSITTAVDGESWIHEGFTKYLETIYTSYVFGTEAGDEYALGINKRIKNQTPIIGSETSDKYNKGSAMLHMIRQVVGDSTFKQMLRSLNKRFYHATVSTEQILQEINQSTGFNFSKVFEQYLRRIDIPVLEYSFDEKTLRYRWANCVDGFNMPLKISVAEMKEILIYPKTEWQEKIIVDNFVSGKDNNLKRPAKNLSVSRNFYVTMKKVN